jgi:hypothetical protein
VTSQAGDGKITVRNSEYIRDVVCTAEYEVTSLPINPGLVGSFMWLSSIANNYEFYRFQKLHVTYKPLVGTSVSGNVMMTFDFDAADEAPTSKQRLMSYMNAMQTAVYSPCSLDAAKVNLKKFAAERFTRPDTIPVNKDIKTYDVANLYIATSGGNGATVGSLYVDYEVQFSTPHTPGYAPWYSSAVFNSTTCALASPLQGSVAVNASVGSPIVELLTNSSFNVKKAGEYLFSTTAVGTGLSNLMAGALWSPEANSGAVFTNGQNVTSTTSYQVSYSKLKVPKDDTSFQWLAPAWTTLGQYKAVLTPFYGDLPIA